MTSPPPRPPGEDPPLSGADATSPSGGTDPPEEPDWDSKGDAGATKWGLFWQLILTMVLYLPLGLTPTFGAALVVTYWTLAAWVVTLVVCFFWSFALINRQKRAYYVPMVGSAVTALIFVVYLAATTNAFA